MHAVRREPAAAPSAQPLRFFAFAAVLASLFLSARASAQTRFYAVDGATLTLTGVTSVAGAIPVADGGTGVYYVWADVSNAVAGSSSVYVTHLSSTGALAAGWPTANSGKVQVTNSANGANNGQYFALADGAGGVVVVYPGASGAASAGYAARINSSGTALWSSKPLTPGNSAVTPGWSPPSIVGGNLMFAHESIPASSTNIYVGALSLATGNQVFAANGNYGVLISSVAQLGVGGGSSPVRDFGSDGSRFTTTGIQNGDRYVIPDGGTGVWYVYGSTLNGVGGMSSVYAIHYSSAGGAGASIQVANNYDPNGNGMSAVADGAGGVAVTWSDLSGIGYGQRISLAGSALWSCGAAPCGKTIYGGPLGFSGLTLADPATLMFGQAFGTTPTTLYVQALNAATGANVFASSGVVVTTVTLGAGGSLNYVAAPSPAGGGQANAGMIVALALPFAGASGTDVYSWRVDNTGAINWAQQLTNAPGDQGNKPQGGSNNNGEALTIDRDGSGGAYVAWVSSQNAPGGDIYAARLTNMGAFAAGWSFGGVRIAQGLTQAGNLALAAAASNGFVLEWTNNSNPTTQVNPVFVQEVTAAGAPLMGLGGTQVGAGQVAHSRPDGYLGGGAAVIGSTGTAPLFFVAWSSNSASTPNPMLVQSLDTSGNLLYAAPFPVVAAPGTHGYMGNAQIAAAGNNLAVLWQEGTGCSGPCANYTYNAQMISTYTAPTSYTPLNPQISVAPSLTAVNPGIVLAYASMFSPPSTNISLEAVKVDAAAGAIDWQQGITNAPIASALDQTFGGNGSNIIVADVDGSGGVFIGWVSSQASPGGEIYATQLAGANGAPLNGFAASGNRIAYGNNANSLSIMGAGVNGFGASWNNEINGHSASGNPVIFQMVSTAAVTKFGVGSSPASPGGTAVGVGIAPSNGAAGGGVAVTSPTAGAPYYFVAWSSSTGSGASPVVVQAFDAGGNKLFGNGFAAIQNTAGRNANSVETVPIGAANIALGWGENVSGNQYDYAQFISTALYSPVAPTLQSVTAVSSGSLTANWSIGSTFAVTGFELDVSTVPGFTGAQSFSSATTNSPSATSLSIAGLSPNSTYFIRVGATWTQAPIYSGSLSTATLAVSLVQQGNLIGPLAQGSTAFLFTYNVFTSTQASGYRVEVSTDPTFSGFGAVFSSQTAALAQSSLTVSGLTGNTRYYSRAGALNVLGVANFQSIGSTVMFAGAPANGFYNPGGTTANSITAAFGATNSTSTYYRTDISTDNFATVKSSQVVTGNAATFPSLTANTTYFFRTFAVQFDGALIGPNAVTSTMTLAFTPTSPAVTGVSTNAISMSWSLAGNPGGTTYYIAVSTLSSLANALFSVSTFNAPGTLTGVLSNATYYMGVAAANALGTLTPYAVAAATATNPVPPTTAAPTALSTFGFTANWNGSNNQPGTNYSVQLSTDNFATFNLTVIVPSVNYAFTGLAANTTYYSRAAAQAWTSGNLTPYTVLPTTMTLLAAPAPAAPSLAGVLATGATGLWTANGNGPGTVYVAQISTDATFGFVNASSSTQNLYAAFASLTPNTSYQIRVEATSGGNTSAFVTLGSTYTAALAPSAAPFSGIGNGGLTVNWTANGNNPSTLYQAQISTNNFSNVYSSTMVTSASASFGGLPANTTFWAQVAPFSNQNGAYAAFVLLGSTATTTAPPTAGSYVSISTGGFVANWGANGNPAGTAYQILLSTDNFATVNGAANTTATSQAFAGLIPNTTYYAQVAAFSVNTSTYTSYTALGGVLDLAAVPAAPAVSAVTTTAETLSWGAAGNPVGTRYAVEYSTDNFATQVGSSITLNTSATALSLASNTTFYFRVRSLNYSFVASAFAVAAASSTKVAAPVGQNPSSVTSNSIAVSWGVNGNSATTLYTFQVSTDPAFGTITASSATIGSTVTFTGLSANTTYYAELTALGNDGNALPFSVLGSTMTLPLIPAAAATPFAGVTTAALTANWASGGNGLGSLYKAQLSTDNFATVNFTSATQNLNATFGVGGAGAALAANATYYVRVQAQGGGGASPYFAVGSTITAAGAPTAGAFTGVFIGSITANWGAGGNSSSTTYTVQIATDPAFGTLTNSAATTLTANTFTGLTQNTTYYARVAAFSFAAGGNGAFVPLASTGTQTTFPTAAAYAGLTNAALTANWTANGNPPGTFYGLQLSTDNFATTNLQTGTTNLTLAFAGLLPNATYYVRVTPYSLYFDAYLQGATALGGVSTVGNVPSAPAAASAGVNTASFAWGANANPAYTLYNAQISTDNFATVNASSVTLNASASFSGLASNTTYYYRAASVNSQGTASAFATAAASSTVAALPLAAAPTGVTAGTITDNFTTNGNGPGFYLVQIATDPAYGSLTASSQVYAAAGGASASFLGLSANTTYYSRVAARGNDAVFTAFQTLVSTVTPPLTPAAAGAPFTGVTAAALTANWASGGNGAGSLYNAQLSTDNFATTNVSSATQNLSAIFGTGGVGAALIPNATYYVRVQAVGSLNSSAFFTVGSTITAAAAPTASAFTGVFIGSITANWGAGGNSSSTTYTVQIATDPAFGTLTNSAATTLTANTFTGLTQNTTYYARVAAFSFAAGGNGAFVPLTSTGTQTTFPTAAAYAGLTNAALTANWTANGNPSGTFYGLQLSTDNFATTNLQAGTTNLTLAFAGLLPNATYYVRVTPYSLYFDAYLQGATALGAVSTIGNVPSAPAVSASGLTAQTLGWTANSNPAYTVYQAQISTDNFATIVQSSATLNLNATFSGLASDTTYYGRVASVNSQGSSSAFATAAASSTALALPVSAAPTGLTASAVTANWLANGDGPATVYTAQVSTDAFVTVNASSVTFGVSATFSGLLANTAYNFRVKALGNDGSVTAFVNLPSTTTLLLPPALAGTTYLPVGYSSVTFQWAAGGNGPGTYYNAQLSTDNFATINVTSVTQNLNAYFGSGGAGAALIPNTTYFARVQSTGTANTSAFLSLGSTTTLAFAPTTLSVVVQVTSTTAQVTWSANGNPSTTTYELWRDVTNGFSAPVKTVVPNATFYLSVGLAANTTYFFQVRTAANGGLYTGFSNAVSTATLPPAPGIPGTPFGVATGTSTLSWSWTSAQYALSYLVYRAQTGSQLASTSTLAYNEAALAPNTAYGLQVAGLNATAPGPLSLAATVYTLATPPAASVASGITATSATISWALNGNPAGTDAYVERSTNNVVYATAITSDTNVSFTDFSLIGCTTYYFRVRNTNFNGLFSAYDSTVVFTTQNSTPLPAGSLTAQAVGANKVSLSWTASPTEGITGYDLFYDSGTGTVNYGVALASLGSSATSYLTGVLPSTAAYTFALRAKHRCGVEETAGVFAVAAASAALAAVRADVLNPTSGRRIQGNSVSVYGGLVSGSASSLLNVRFQYKLHGASVWTDMAAVDAPHPNPAVAAPFFIHWNTGAAGLVNGSSYDLRAVATDISSTTDSAPDVVTVVYDTGVTADIVENAAAGQVTRVQTFNTGTSNAFVCGGSGVNDPLINITIPGGAVNGSTAAATIVTVPTLSTTPPAGFSIIGGLTIRITLSNGQSVLNGLTAPLCFTYPGTLNGPNPQIWALNENTGVWSQDFATTQDSANHLVCGNTPHFTAFAVLAGGAAAADLSGVRVYPNPYRPNSGDANRGGGNTGIIIDNLPAQAGIKIYTVSGQLVASFDASSIAGKVVWNSQNDKGRDVATGMYIAVISSSGHGNIIKKILVIR